MSVLFGMQASRLVPPNQANTVRRFGPKWKDVRESEHVVAV
jgi:hypothetical protein